MLQKPGKRRIDWGQVTGAVIFILFFCALILLGLYYDSDTQFESSFFEDVARAIKWE
ncbi:hypothetical protein MNBD_GAMMA11-1931 [hydrothermal vent metagenome]|uniref:Uncharacterized protein n=1 Tax=hydrothermal vent metagenome TaxID=652676 RepID=A0A3B0XUP7_9ZZZZ